MCDSPIHVARLLTPSKVSNIEMLSLQVEDSDSDVMQKDIDSDEVRLWGEINTFIFNR